MFDYNNFYDFIQIDKKSISDLKAKGSVHKPNIFAIHFGRLNSYNPDWDLRKILAFELFMHLSRKYGHKPFTQKYSMLKPHLHCHNDKIKKLIKELEDEGFVEVIREKEKGVSKLNYYSVNFDNILSSLEKIYNFEGMSKTEKSGSIEIMQEYIKYHAETGCKKREEVSQAEAESIDPSELGPGI